MSIHGCALFVALFVTQRATTKWLVYVVIRQDRLSAASGQAKVIIIMYQDGYDLFRQAIVEQDADAWAMIAERYRNLLIAWAARCPGANTCGECYGDLADEALARAWKALTPQRFATFPALAWLLAYLRVCVTATVIDATRARVTYEHAFQYVDSRAYVPTEQTVIERLGRVELWQLVMSLATTEAEQVVLRERFVLNLPPRIILARHPALFSDVNAIYTVLRNLRDRLRRHKELARLCTEHLAA
jgi:DNA-directed RNA polymerase specialized sigma24 family protein